MEFQLDKQRSPPYNTLVQQSWSILILLLFMSVFTGIKAEAAEPTAKIHGILINADEMFRDTEKELVELQGNIQIVFQGQHIKADRAKISLRVRQIELYGNVEVMDAKNTIVGDRVFLDYDNNTGLIYNGYVQSGSVLFSGDLLQKTGDSEFIVSSADYTTCTNCPATWSFTGTTVRAELGGYAYIKNAILRIADVPVFWLPYLIVPLKSDRQSGLLTPNFEVSNEGGFTIAQPYFWAISRSSDATITAKHYERRGTKGLLEYRYMLDENSYGIFNGASIFDRSFSQDDRLNIFRPPNEKDTTIDRWFVKYDHYFEMPHDYTHRAQINLASDLQYPKDFPLETMNHGDSAMENRVSFTKNTKDQHYSVDSSYWVNLLHANPLSGNNDAVHRLPELRFAQTQQNIGNTNVLYSLDLDYVNFARSGNSYDDMTVISGSNIKIIKNTCLNDPKWEDNPICKRVFDGTYDPDIDLIRTGQRLDFQPTLYYPIKMGDGFDVLPKLGYRETHYNFNVGDDQNYVRRYLRTELSGRLNFSRIYGDVVNSKATRYKHEIVPELTYTHIPWIEQKNHPFFGTGRIDEAPYSSRDGISDADINSAFGLQFDYSDRIYDRNLATFAITNKITEKRWVGDRPEYRQIATLKLAQSYDATQETKTGPEAEPYSDISASLDVRLDHFQTYSVFNYFPYQNVTNTSSRIRMNNDQGQFFQVQVTRRYIITPGQKVDVDARTEDYTFYAGFTSHYINLMGRFVYDANWANQARGEAWTDRIKSWAYIAQLKPPGDCWGITFIHDQITGGDTNFKISFEFNFDGQPKPPLSPDILDTFGF